MSTRDLAEAMALAVALSDMLLVKGGPRGQTASDLRRAVTRFQANLETGYRTQMLGPVIAGLFDAAVAAGLAATSFRAVRDAARNAVTHVDLAAWTRRSFWRQALVAEVRQLAAVNFTDRDAVDAARAGLITAFDDVIEDASEMQEFQIMRDLTSLFTAIQRHLATTAIPLPRLITFDTPSSLPSLVLAHRLYGDASRRQELERGSKVVHPLFMPRAGRALAS
ncbi:MAG TPA: hypothetical protein VNX29_05450 [Kaistia sp.]|nr:hypothetical protein [Kaistia sp.]